MTMTMTMRRCGISSSTSLRSYFVVVLMMILGSNVVILQQVMGEDLMFSGETLNTNQFLESGTYKFIMQGDCNLVLYVNGNRPLWASGTNGRGSACKATLQTNGNLVVLSGTDVVWTSNSARGANQYRLIVQSDGNVVIYGSALWATNTVQRKRALQLLTTTTN